MSRRTRKTFQGMKSRFSKKKVKRHGDIRRLVGDTPLKSLKEAAIETLEVGGLPTSSDQFYASVKHATGSTIAAMALSSKGDKPIYKCKAGCGYPVAHAGAVCGECSCEDDCAPD